MPIQSLDSILSISIQYIAKQDWVFEQNTENPIFFV